MPGYILRVDTQPAVSGPLWRALADRSEPASIAQLHVACAAHPNAIQLRLRSWTRAGLVNVLPGKPNTFIMKDAHRKAPSPPSLRIDGTPANPRDGRARMWRAMRVLRSFDLPTLIMTAEVTRRSGEDYINALMRAGLLRRVRRGNAATNSWSVYALVSASGPATPIVRHTQTSGQLVRQVFDPNTGNSHDISPRRASFFDGGN